MKKNYPYFLIFVITLFFTIVQKAFSQTPEVKWGPVLSEPSGTYTARIIGNDARGFYTLRSKTNHSDLFLERYDANSNLEFSRRLVMPLPENVKGKNLKFEGIYYIGGQLIMFSSYLNDKIRKNAAFANKLNYKGDIDPAMVEVGVIEGATRNKPGEFHFQVSNDSSKILVFRDVETKSFENRRFEYKVLDSNLNVVAAKAVQLPELTKTIDVLNYSVDNDANVYVLVGNFKPEEAQNKTSLYDYRILAYFTNGSNKEYAIKVKDKYIASLTFSIDKNKDLLVGGFYGFDWNTQPNSVFFTKIDYKTKEIITHQSAKLPKEVLHRFMNKKDTVNEHAGMVGMHLQKLIVKEDGGAVLVAEQSWITVTRTRNGNNYHTTRDFHNYEVMFISLQPTGAIDWVTCIPKFQKTTNDGGMYNSYSLSLIGGKIYLIYNDHAENININDPNKMLVMKNPDKAVTMLAILDGSGSFKRKVLFPAKEAKTIVRPTYYFQDNDSVIIYSETGRDYRYGNIRFN